jgi:hypothetical protein
MTEVDLLQYSIKIHRIWERTGNKLSSLLTVFIAGLFDELDLNGQALDNFNIAIITVSDDFQALTKELLKEYDIPPHFPFRIVDRLVQKYFASKLWAMKGQCLAELDCAEEALEAFDHALTVVRIHNVSLR